MAVQTIQLNSDSFFIMAPKQSKSSQRAPSRPAVSRASSAPVTQKTAPPQQQQQQSFMFLDTSGTGEESAAEWKRSARSFVMQKARREKPWSTRRQGSPKLKRAGSRAASPTSSARGRSRDPEQKVGRSSAPSRSLTPIESRSSSAIRLEESTPSPQSHCAHCIRTGSFTSGLCASCANSPTRSANHTIFNGIPNPILRELSSQKEEALMMHWLENICPEYIDIDINRQCTALRQDCALLLQDRAAIQAVLCFAAQSLALQGQASAEDVIFYKGQAIAEINNNLSDPLNGMSDSCIFAVFVLLCLEERCYGLASSPAEIMQDAQQRIVHLRGLEHMVHVRGGLSSLTSNKTLQSLLAWHAVADSMLSVSTPWLPLNDWRETFTYPRAQIFTSDIRSPLLRQCLDSELIVHKPLAKIANDVSYYTAELESWYTNPTPEIDPIKLQSWGVSLQSRLQDWLDTPDQLTTRSTSSECLGLALLAFVTKITMTRDRGFDPVQFAILGRLRNALSRSRGEEWSSMPLALVWTLSIGGLCSVSSADEIWFATHFRGACQLFSIWSLDELKASITQLYWMDCRLQEPLDAFWWRSASHDIAFEHLEWSLFIGIESLQLLNPPQQQQQAHQTMPAEALASTTTATPPISESPPHRIAPSPERLWDTPDYGLIPDRGAILGYAFGNSAPRAAPCPLCHSGGCA